MKCFVIILILLVKVQHNNALSCQPEHPQAAFCRADFVLKGQLVSVLPRNDEMMVHMQYESVDITIKIHTIYKGEDALKTKPFEMATIRAVIDKSWSAGKEYLVSGHHAPNDATNFITPCNWVVEWRKVSYLQRIALKRYYQMNCMCKFTTCFTGNFCMGSKNKCLWDIRKESFRIAKDKLDCTSQKSLCWFKGEVDGEPHCVWYTPANHKCKIYEAEEP